MTRKIILCDTHSYALVNFIGCTCRQPTQNRWLKNQKIVKRHIGVPTKIAKSRANALLSLSIPPQSQPAMAIIFGAHSLSSSSSTVFNRLADVLLSTASGLGNLQIQRHEGVLLACRDLRIWNDASALQNGAQFVAVGGQPVCMAQSAPHGQRAAQLLPLFNGNPTNFRECHGSYCAAFLNNSSKEIKVVTDKLGVRPIYHAVVDNVLVFASALWMLEGINELVHDADFGGVAEQLAYGHPLGDRTVFKRISTLSPGSMLHASPSGLQKYTYWNWLEEINSEPSKISASDLENEFSRAVLDRLGNNQHALAALSGGMDSRWIVQNLRKHNINVHSFNVAPAGSKDRYFGKLAAQALGTTHHEYSGSSMVLSTMLGEVMEHFTQSGVLNGTPLDKTRIIWSGDGGSVGVGHVYITEQMIQVARHSGVETILKECQEFNRRNLSTRLVNPLAADICSLPLKGALEELQKLSSLEPGRACHVFFMLNDQRRHLARHYETLHQHRVDFVLPFYDARLIKTILNAPIDDFILHKIYHEVFLKFSGPIAEVPWQTYPGHVLCPIKSNDKFRNQWEDGIFDPKAVSSKKKSTYWKGLHFVTNMGTEKSILSRKNLLTATLLSILKIRDYEYFINTAMDLHNRTKYSADKYVQ